MPSTQIIEQHKQIIDFFYKKILLEEAIKGNYEIELPFSIDYQTFAALKDKGSCLDIINQSCTESSIKCINTLTRCIISWKLTDTEQENVTLLGKETYNEVYALKIKLRNKTDECRQLLRKT